MRQVFAADALNGRKALVFGASRGLGRAAAEQLAAMGAEVALLSRSAERLEAVADELAGRYGVKAAFEVADLADEAALAAVLARHADTDILVTNCGGPPLGPFTETPLAEWDRAYRQIVRAVVQATQALLPHMATRGFGRIIMIASRTVKHPLPRMSISNALRKALVGIAETIADEFGSKGITANLVCPGLTRTERMREVAAMRAEREGRSQEDIMAELLRPIAAGRAAEPWEIGAAVGFLASDAAAYVQAQCLLVDGGRRLGC